MQCRDAQFYLRLRRHAGDELGADVAADLDRHLAGCPACGADALAALAFDRAVAVAIRAVPVPAGLREKLLTQAAEYRGGVIRRRAYRLVAVAASLFLVVGLGFGAFFSTRPRIDTDELVRKADEQFQNPDEALRRWLVAQNLPDHLPRPFNTDLLITLGTERVQGKDVPVAVFAHPTERGFAKVFLFRTDGTYKLDALRDTMASNTAVEVVADQRQFPGVKYVILYTAGPDGLKPFLRNRAT